MNGARSHIESALQLDSFKGDGKGTKVGKAASSRRFAFFRADTGC